MVSVNGSFRTILVDCAWTPPFTPLLEKRGGTKVAKGNLR